MILLYTGFVVYYWNIFFFCVEAGCYILYRIVWSFPHYELDGIFIDRGFDRHAQFVAFSLQKQRQIFVGVFCVVFHIIVFDYAAVCALLRNTLAA